MLCSVSAARVVALVLTRAVVLAAGLGTRMRAPDPLVVLTPEQRAAADAGIKALIPVPRPLLDYSLSALADAGVVDVCIVVSPRSDAIRERYGRPGAVTRVHVSFAVQPEPLGTANALLTVQEFARREPFLVVNSDNYYPPSALAQLRAADGNAVVAYSRAGLTAHGAIPADRVAAYAILDVRDGRLERIVEKPGAAELQSLGPGARVSMNSWRFTHDIFAACREVPRSPRGEWELPLAVQYGIDVLGMTVNVVESDVEVLDLSSRADIPVVERRLAHVIPHP